MKHRKIGVLFLALFLAAIGSVLAQISQDSDFLSDYSQLQESSNETMDYTYLAAGAPDRMATYAAIMIDQPEIFVSPDSDYKGMKPDDMKELADAFRSALAESLGEDYLVVDQPGPNVLYLRFALSNVLLKKQRRRLLSYTPIGLVTNAVRSAITDITDKIDLKGLTIEMEVLDSTSEEQLAALSETRSQTEEEPTSWAEVEALIDVYGQRVRCRLDNARLAEADRVDCLSGV